MNARHLMMPGMVLIASLVLVPCSLAQGKKDPKASQERLAEDVRRSLIMLPNYTLFDNLEFRIAETDTVVLSGQVTRPILKSEAESVVRRLERAGKVVNNIEVLPLSPQDDRIRVAAYRAIYGKPGLDRYARMAIPPIHIIVRNGDITLVGLVDNQADKDLAGLAAQGIPGTFKIVNSLSVKK